MLRQIATEVFQIPLMPRNSINSYIIEGVLVDCGIRSSYTTIKKVIQKIAVHQHVLTHAHADHQGVVIRYAQSSTFLTMSSQRSFQDRNRYGNQ
jgi:glyoxylase-like metal-dependent hydrolase (beta-lactamase superfamily II)